MYTLTNEQLSQFKRGHSHMNLVKKVSDILDGVLSQICASLSQIIVLRPLIMKEVIRAVNGVYHDVRPIKMQLVDFYQPLAIDVCS